VGIEDALAQRSRCVSVGRVHHFDCGATCPCGAAQLAGGDFATRVTVLETSEGPVLVDAGYARAYLAEPKRDLLRWALLRPRAGAHQAACERLGAVGLAPGDVRHVLLTHLDFDHASGVLDFPRARLYVWADELERARSPKSPFERYRYRDCERILAGRDVVALRAESTVGGPFAHPLKGAVTSTPLPTLASELRVVSLPGHTAGHAGVAFVEEGIVKLHAGDAVYDMRELDARAGLPAIVGKITSALHVDASAARVSRALLARWRDAGVRVYCAHDSRGPEDDPT
jgi:glyoxylase-like metal-dependent hydrolase (beta-lactamase superfamily II)